MMEIAQAPPAQKPYTPTLGVKCASAGFCLAALPLVCVAAVGFIVALPMLMLWGSWGSRKGKHHG